MLANRKIVIIGAGHVGSHCAYALAIQGICDEIVLVDKDRTKAKSHSMDIADEFVQAISRKPSPTKSQRARMQIL